MGKNMTDQAAPELLPCPFCGGEAFYRSRRVSLYDSDYTSVSVGCDGCGLTIGRVDDPMHAMRWNRRADLAAPSAPAEVDGLVRRLRDEHLAMTREEAATALTALQAENERLREAMRGLAGTLAEVEGRARKAEADRDAWKANAEALRSRLVSWCGDESDYSEDNATLAAHAKLKGEA